MRSEDRVGLELTIIIHLIVIIILLVFGIGRELQDEHSFVLDFSRQEEREQRQAEQDFQEDVSRRVDELIEQAGNIPIRNVAVNRGILRDDRNSLEEADKLYSDAERLAKELQKGYQSDIEEDAREETVELTSRQPQSQESRYTGPSVLSWTLDGRKASRLPIPAYRCMGAGEVTIAIVVDRQGNVVNAKVSDAASSEDRCLREFAVRAARLSKFSCSTSAPLRQVGEICYCFVAQ